jgi:hypothetical protein
MTNWGLQLVWGTPPPSLAAQVQVIKGDTQKADSANMPEHLWVYAFLYGYGPGAHGPRHLQALGLPPMASVGGLLNPIQPKEWESTFLGLSMLALFWLLGLSRWRQQVLRGLFAWWKRNIRIIKGCSPGQMVHPVLVIQNGQRSVSFEWSLRGKASYKAQWELGNGASRT